MIIISNNTNKKKAPLVYINRVKMTEFDRDGKYEFIPVIRDDKNEIIDRDKLDKEKQKEYDKAVEKKIKCDRNNHMILTAESELIRIIRHLSERNQTIKDKDYIPDILSLKVGRSYSTYKETMTKTEMNVTYNGIKYKRIIVSSSHSRTQKAMFVSVDLWDKAMDILLCGLNRDTKYKYTVLYSEHLYPVFFQD